MPYHVSEIKRKLRDLKRLEIQLCFNGQANVRPEKLVWTEFFAFRRSLVARYYLEDLIKLTREEFKEIIEEYFFSVYFRLYQKRGVKLDSFFDPNLLKLLGLPPFATQTELKTRFRELAKKSHPDMGGDSEEFIALMNVYNRLTGE